MYEFGCAWVKVTPMFYRRIKSMYKFGCIWVKVTTIFNRRNKTQLGQSWDYFGMLDNTF